MTEEPTEERLNQTYKTMEELYHDRDVDMIIPDDPTKSAEFELSEQDTERLTQQLQNDDGLVLKYIAWDFMEMDEQTSEAYAQQLFDSAEWIHDRSGVNIFRVLERNPDAMPGFDVAAMPEELKERYDA